MSNDAATQGNAEPARVQEVVITGIEIPIVDLVGFIFKWTLASIPTALLLAFLLYRFWTPFFF